MWFSARWDALSVPRGPSQCIIFRGQKFAQTVDQICVDKIYYGYSISSPSFEERSHTVDISLKVECRVRMINANHLWEVDYDWFSFLKQ